MRDFAVVRIGVLAGRFLVGAVLLSSLIGCGVRRYSAPPSQPAGPCPDYQMSSYRENTTSLSDLASGRRPKNYKALIDANLEETLKDPASRTVKWGSTPGENLVCAKVNAKNSYGGYTGYQTLIGRFDAGGNLVAVDLLSSRDVAVGNMNGLFAQVAG